MPKRGIDTPAKDDPNRKKARTRPEDLDANANANADESSSSRSKPAPTLIQSVFTALSSPVVAHDITSRSEAAVDAATRPKHAASATSGMARVWARALGAGHSAKKIPSPVDNKNTNGQAATPAKKSLDTPESSEVRKDVTVESSGPKIAEPPTKRSTWGTSLIVILGILNIASMAYIIYEQSRHNTAHMRCLVEIEKLNDELTRNRGVMSILQSGMDAAENRVKFIEQEQESRRKTREEERREKTVGLSEEERNASSARTKSLIEKREQLLAGFHHWLVELNGMDGTQ
ncbi:hypothetical protein ACHAW6_006007 [Cyclotella cf. meneghiniana]